MNSGAYPRGDLDLYALPPAFGMHIEVTETEILIVAHDDPGRGRPHFGLLFPVEDRGGFLDPTGDPERDPCFFHLPEPDADVNSPQSAASQGLVVKKAHKFEAFEESTHFAFRILREEWPTTLGKDCLMLLCYYQTEGVGGYAPPVAGCPDRLTGKISATMEAAADKPIVDGLKTAERALACYDLDVLRIGLIQGSAPDASAINPSRVRFAFSSCQYPSDLFDFMPDGVNAVPGPADASLLALAKLLDAPDTADDGNNRPSLLLLGGDQVYIDAQFGVLDPKLSSDQFRVSYQRRNRSRGYSAVAHRLDLRIEAVMDDHEIRDNWVMETLPEDEGSPAVEAARDCFEAAQKRQEVRDGKRVPVTENDAEMKPKDALYKAKKYFRLYQRGDTNYEEDQLVWRPIEHRGLNFFLGDTRTERELRTATDWQQKHIMGSDQRMALCEWLESNRDKGPKFVLTSSTLLPRRLDVSADPFRGLQADGWDGYPRTFCWLLGHICEKQIDGVVFLSGDAHIPFFTKATISDEDGKSCVIHSIHSSAFYAPYPFANSHRDDFAGDETFHFTDEDQSACETDSESSRAKPPKSYKCEVRTWFPDPTNGFAIVTATNEDSGWDLSVEFHSARGAKPRPGTFHWKLNQGAEKNVSIS